MGVLLVCSMGWGGGGGTLHWLTWQAKGGWRSMGWAVLPWGIWALSCTVTLPLPSLTTPHRTALLARPLRRLEVRCGGLEGEIKELRKSQKETVSELKLEQNSVKQAAYEVREAAERRQHLVANSPGSPQHSDQ